MISLKTIKPLKISIISGSPRHEDSCSGGKSKTSKIVEHVLSKIKSVKFELFDLSVLDGKPIVQPCKGCISTANGFQCHYPCSCYAKGTEDNKDYMHEMDVYSRLEASDVILTFTPIHWYTVTSVVKAFFDRLVCINLTLSVDLAREVMGKDAIKNSEKTKAAELSGKYKKLLKNHYENKIFGIFAHGDEGANDYNNYPKPTSLAENDDESKFNQLIGLMPLAYQMRYSGLYVPDDLVEYHRFGKNIPYAKNNESFSERSWILEKSIEFVERAIQHAKKTKVKETMEAE